MTIQKESIRNIFCAGRSYKLHAIELGNAVPSKPIFFMKPTHSLGVMDGNIIELPSNKGEIHYEAEIVLHMDRAYSKGAKVEELVEHITLGIDFTMRDLQSTLKAQGQPWLAAKGFRNGALIGHWIPTSSLAVPFDQLQFTLQKNGTVAQQGNANDMLFSFQEIIDYCAESFGLGVGDIIYTGTPAGVAAVNNNDHLVLKLGDNVVGECTIQFE